MRQRTMFSIALSLGIVGIACLVNQWQGIRGRKRRKMFRPQHKVGTWKRCSVCGEYSHTTQTQCDNVQHNVPAVLCNVSTVQLARVATVLMSATVRQNIETPDEYYAFGSHFLWLEERTARKWDSSSALIVFLLSEEDQMCFYDLMKEYEALVPSYVPSGLVTLWLALHKDTAKVMQ